jgi:hypothetical protein
MFDGTQPRAMNGRFAEKLGSAPDLALAHFEEPDEWPFDEYEMDTYTAGECYRLARALEQLGVGELTAVTTEDDPTGWNHMVVKLPGEERYMDIVGIHTAEELKTNWADGDGLLAPVLDYEDAIRGQGQGAYTDEDAQEVAVRLVEACTR